jgi:Uma2 family endonuclease
MVSAQTPEKTWTTEDLLAMPDDGIRRWVIDGKLYEQLPDGTRSDEDMTVRNRFHSNAMVHISGELYIWWNSQPESRGILVCGEAGVRFPGADTTIGVDVAYVPRDVVMEQTEQSTIIRGVPTLIVEILSKSDRLEEVDQWLASYRDAGVPLVWVVDTTDRTVTIYKPGEEPTMVNAAQELDGGEPLPGFRVPVAKLFA